LVGAAVTDTPLLDLSPSRHAQDGVAASDDKQYRYALWRFWDISRPYILFVSLNPKSLKDSAACMQLGRTLPAIARQMPAWCSGAIPAAR
jgi:hypothetical protein